MKLQSPRLFKGKCKCGNDIEMLIEWQWQLTHSAQQFCKVCCSFTPVKLLDEVKT